MLLPALRVQRQKGQHVDRRLKDIEGTVLAHVVEAVLGPAALHVNLEGFTLAVGAPLVDMVGDAVLVRAHKGPVVILDILLQQPSPGEASDCLPSDVSPLHKANVNTAHIDVRQRPGKRLEWSLSVEYGTLTQVIYLAYPLAISGS